MNNQLEPYDEFGLSYHCLLRKTKKDFWNRYIEYPKMEQILKEIVKDKKVLDLGCGSGIFTKKLSKWGAEVEGLDRSKTMIELAKKENPKIKFFVADVSETLFEKSNFDIVCSNLLIHYYKNLNLLFNEISRILKNQGLFVFSFTHPFNEVISKKLIRRKWEYSVRSYFHNKEYSWEMLPGMKIINYHHTFELISKALNKNGFVMEKIFEPVPIKLSKKIDRLSYKKAISIPTVCIIQARKKN